MSISFNDFIGDDAIILTGTIPNPEAKRLAGSQESFSFVLTGKKLMYHHYDSICILPLKNIKTITIDASTINAIWIDEFKIAYGPEKAEFAKRLFNEIAKRIV